MSRRLLLVIAALFLSGLLYAQTGIPLTRIFSGADGQTHAEEIRVDLGVPRNGGAFSPQMKAETMTFLRRAANALEDWHTAPRRQYAITLSGHAELEIGDGKSVPLAPGGVVLIEDTSGKGHRVRTTAEEWTAVFVPVAAP
jgi:quercetin dioxygenase-like cupin family protein